MATHIFNYITTKTLAGINFDLENGAFTGIGMRQAFALKTLCPHANLDAELNRAAAWLVTHPDSRPKACTRFVTTWLSLAQARTGPGMARAAALALAETAFAGFAAVPG